MDTTLEEAAHHLQAGRMAEALRLALLACADAAGDALAPAIAAAASHALGRPEDGMRWFRAAIALDPDDPELSCGLAACQFDLRLCAAARATLEALLREHPTHLRSWCNLALACEEVGDTAAAASALERAARLAPGEASTLRAQAAFALRAGRAADALRLADEARAMDGDSAQTLHLILECALKASLAEPAAAAARELLARDPHDAYARRGLAAVHAIRGDFVVAATEASQVPQELLAGFDPRVAFLSAGAEALRRCEWHGLPAWLAVAACLARDPHATLDAAEFPFQAVAAGLDPGLCDALFAAHARDLGDRHLPVKWPRPALRTRRRARIGYIGAGFADHPEAMLVNPILAAHDRTRFEVYAYALTGDDGSHWRAESVASADVFRSAAHMSSAECAGLIMVDDIDILVDLSGVLAGGRPGVHLHRPARTRLLLYGTPVPLGLPGVDAVIGDDVVLAPGDSGLRLPGCYLPVDPRWSAWAREGEAPSRRDHQLPEDAPVLCCFNSAYKIEPQAFGIWMRILARAPDAVLWLLNDDAAVRDNLRAQAVAAGIDGSRLVFAGRLPLKDHLKRFRLADVFVDTFHCGAHVTAVQALAAGLPLLTIRGDRFSARVGASALIHAGLADLLATDMNDYVERALQFCQRSAIAADWRHRTQAAFAPETAIPRFAAYVQALERLYLQAFEQAGGRT